MRMLVTPNTDFSSISWNWLCYQRAFSAIYQKYFWKLTLFADAILLQTWLYSHMPSLVWMVWKTNEILHIVQSVALGVCFSIYTSVYISNVWLYLNTIYNNIIQYKHILYTYTNTKEKYLGNVTPKGICLYI